VVGGLNNAANGNASAVPAMPLIGIHVHGINATFDWMMVITTPN